MAFTVPAQDFIRIRDNAKVIKDRPDLRDLPYQPTLAVLEQARAPEGGIFRRPGFVRNQWDARQGVFVGNCTAQALGSVIDLLRCSAGAAAQKVAAGMLYFRGHEVEAAEQGRAVGDDPGELPSGLRSLRSALKGFYHNGVCLDATWDGRGAFEGGADSVEVGKEARQIPLGSYYRLQPILNDYHAALNEVGAIYAAAEIHQGWEEERVRANGGMIALPEDRFGDLGAATNHAFVIVGYNQQGFLVLNSWGPDWGGYPQEPGRPRSPRMPGVALWRYQDWAERILDGWVLRLGVTAPDAFKYSFGPQGLAGFASGEISYASTPRHELMGHYVHIDDGELVDTGTLPSTLPSLAATRELIRKRHAENPGPAGARPARSGKSTGSPAYRNVMIWIAGGNEPTKEAANQVGITKDFWKSRGIYPLTVIWCSDFIESALSLLGKAFDDSLARVGRTGPQLDVRIEADARGVGRAFWRDIKLSAARAAAKDMQGDRRGAGGMYLAFSELLQLDPAIRLHFVAEGAGSILLAELLGELTKAQRGRIASITLNLPACTVDDFEQRYLPWIEETRRGIDILVPDEHTEGRMRVGVYGRSLLDLVQMSFEEQPPVRKQDAEGLALGEIDWEARNCSRILGLRRVALATAAAHPGKVSAVELSGPASPDPIRSMRRVTMGRDAQKFVHALILDRNLESPIEFSQRTTAAAETAFRS